MGQTAQIIQLLMFQLDDRHFAIPLTQVVRVIRAVEPTPVPQAPKIVLGVIDLQGTVLPVLDIRARFGFADRAIAIEDQFIVADTSKRRVVLAVDVVNGMIERFADEIVATSQWADASEQIDGVIQLKDELVLIHDLERFLSPAEELTLEDAVARQSEHGI